MKIVRFTYQGKVFHGSLQGDVITPYDGTVAGGALDTSEVRLLAPVEPSKIVCVGLNYRDHAEELGMKVPDEPVIFIKPATSVTGPEEDIIYPGCVKRLDYEAELAVVIKETARNVSAGDAPAYILGYTCMNDVTARDIQKRDVQWTRAKSFDTFAPLGPWVETDLDTSNIEIRSYLNGKIRQESSTSAFIFTVHELVSFVSGVMTLLPGDVIATGTPPGVGEMKAGDQIEVEIEGIGRLRNRVAAQRRSGR